MKSPQKTVLVTGAGGRSVGSGILHSLLRASDEVRARWRVIAADADPFAWGLYKADDAVLLPFANAPNYVAAVQRVVKERGVDAIVPGTEAEIRPLVENAARLAPAIVIANRLDLLPLMLDKFAAAAKLAELGCRVIPTLPLDRYGEVVAEFGFPLIVKPTRETGGSRGLRLVRDQEEFDQILPLVDRRTNPCVQPYVGDAELEYTVGVLCDLHGKLIDSVVMHRKLIGLSLFTAVEAGNRRYALSTGYSQGFIVREPKIQSFCEQLAVAIGSRGPLNIQLRLDRHGGEPYVFEIHPRFSGTTPIRADVGFNEVDLLLRSALLGESFSRLGYRTEVAAIRAFEHVIVPVEKLLR